MLSNLLDDGQIHAHTSKGLVERDLIYQAHTRVFFACSHKIPKIVPRETKTKRWRLSLDYSIWKVRVYQLVFITACHITFS